MERIEDFSQADQLKENKVYVNPGKSKSIRSCVTFRGKNNVLYVEDNVQLTKSSISFDGNNSVIYLSEGREPYYLSIHINQSNTLYFGKDCFFNGNLSIILSEYQNFIVGNDVLFSMNVWVRTADPHLLYDAKTKKRINQSKGIFIGDHVWIGQDAFLFKGTQIGSGAVVGGASVVSGKKIPSNCCYAGNPAKKLKSGIFFSRECVHSWTPEKTKQYEIRDTDQWIYEPSEDAISFEYIDERLKNASNANDRLEKVKQLLVNRQAKNRFFVTVKSFGA